MKKIGIILLSIGLTGSLCGCLTTIPEGSRKNYMSSYLPRVHGKLVMPLGEAEQQALLRDRWLSSGTP